MNKLQIGIVGCGAIAQQKHIPALKKISDKVELAAFCDGSKIKARQIANHVNKKAKVYNNYEELIRDPGIDVVHICTPNKLHAPIAIEALRQGKHVMCEKPMAINTKDAEKMMEATRHSGKKLTIGYQNRFRKDAIILKEACQYGDLGEIYLAKAHAVRRRGVPTWGVFMNKELQGGGPLIDIGTHALDLTLWCMDNYNVASVTGVTHHRLRHQNKANPFGSWDPDSFEVEDASIGFIQMKNGATIYLEAAWALNTLDEREAMTSLSGTQGGAEMRKNPITHARELIFNGEKYGSLMEMKMQDDTAIDYISPVEETEADREIGQWITAILEDKKPIVLPEQAFKVTQVLEAIYQSAQIGKTIELT
ncbi:Gfo/Idh/MocA family protein [Gracilibacillus phocaeensis]|uniref:Gfo/Idh/MocA family protein n=1 Tax=Gracilibacillus phocaeensis TaxID=2042304 RepID=UPI0010319868|nr:Gfo/Idh/MocA family oxidoreductase [Gracilibacillus phocaeensis]